jgi:hypothetical protein
LPNVKNATSYFENGLKNRFRAIEFRADDYLPIRLLIEIILFLKVIFFIPNFN